MRKRITLILLSIFMVGSLFAQVKRLPATKNYRKVDATEYIKVKNEKKVINSKEGNLVVQGFEDAVDNWPAGWESASTSDLAGADWTATDYTGGDNTWFVCTPESFSGDGADYIYEGDKSAAIGYTAGNEGNPMHWLVSEEVNLPSDTAFLSFMVWFKNSSADGWYTKFYVQIFADDAWSNLLTWNDETEDNVNLYESVVDIDLGNYKGKSVKFGFVFEYNDGYQMAIDSISYMNVPPSDDAGISKFLQPLSGVYEAATKDIEVIVKNYGADTLRTCDVNWAIDNGTEVDEQSVYSWSGELAQFESDTIVLGDYNFANRGDYTVFAYTSLPNGNQDANSVNDTVEVSLSIYETGQLFETYEAGSFENGWSAEDDWIVGTDQPYMGSYDAQVTQMDGDPAAEMITPKLVIDGSIDELSFFASGMNNEAGYGSSKLQIMYSVDKENWENVGELIDFAVVGDNYKKYSVDLSNIPNGEYFLAFFATSDFYYYYWGYYYSSIFIDNVVGPYRTAPVVSDFTPEDEETGVAWDATVSLMFDQAVDSVDYSGITITGATTGEQANVIATIDGDNGIMIAHDSLPAWDEVYTVNIPAGATSNGAFESEAFSWTFTTLLPAPEAVTFTPFNGATGIALDGEISLVFNQEISDNNLAGITVISATDGPVAGLSASVADDYKTVTIVHDDFVSNLDEITIAIPADAVENIDGVMNKDTSWTFTTLEAGQPVADSIAPANNERAVALDANVLVRFSTAITEIDLSGVTINGPEGDVTGIVATLADSTVSIAHDAFANNSGVYTVTIPADAVTAAGVNNSEIQWSFTSIMTAPSIVETTPVTDALLVNLNQELVIEFDQLIDDSQVDMDTLITIIGENEDTVKNISASISDGKIYVSHDDMEYNSAVYTVTIPADMVHNVDSVMNAEYTWDFTTIMAAPVAESVSPDSSSVDILLDADISVVLTQDVTVNDLGGVQIYSAANGNVANISATLGDDNRTITIEHDRFFDTNEDTYTVLLPARSVLNADEVYNTKVMWSFNTIETHDITFKVTDGANAIEEASVVFENTTQTTNTLGVTVFDGVAIGQDKVYAISKDGYNSLDGDVNVSQPTTLVFALDKIFSVTFNVTDGTNALENAIVTFNYTTDTTDADGNAVFNNVDPGNNQVYIVSKDEYNEIYGTIDLVDQNVVESVVMSPLTDIISLEKLGISVYPNPSNGVFYIDNVNVEENALLIVRDITGKVVLSKNLDKSNNRIDVSNNPTGLYLIQISINDKIANSKVIINK